MQILPGVATHWLKPCGVALGVSVGLGDGERVWLGEEPEELEGDSLAVGVAVGLAVPLPEGVLEVVGVRVTVRVGEVVGVDAGGRPTEAVPPLSREAEEACAAAAELHARAGFEPPWTGYLAFDGERCVGACTFKSPPRANRVEIACYPFPSQEGHLEAMMASLMRIAFENHPGILVIAHSLAEEGTETAVLARLGFHLTGRTQDTGQGEVWEWMLQTASS